MIPFHPEPARAPTDGGSATVYLGLTQQDIDWMLQEGTVNIEAEVEGYDLRADPAFVFVTRR